MAKASSALWKAFNESPVVRRALEEKAKAIAARADQISRADGGTARHTVRTGIRPRGRAFADIVSDNPAEEFGTEEIPRINALRRAAKGA